MTLTHDLLLKQSGHIAKVLEQLDDLNKAEQIIKISKKSASCKALLHTHVNYCEDFLDMAYKLYIKLSNNRVHLADEVQNLPGKKYSI